MDLTNIKGPLDPDDNLFTLVFVVGAALAGGPTVLSALGIDVGTWALAHGILVAPELAVVQVPLVGAGLDVRRLLLVLLALAAALVLAVMHVSSRRRRRGAELG